MCADNVPVSPAPVLPRAPEAEFGHGLRAALRTHRDAGVENALLEAISPELVLVCPELRARALRALPEHPPRLGSEPALTQYRRHLCDSASSEEMPLTPSRTRIRAFLAVEAAQVAVVSAAVMAGVAGLASFAVHF